MTTADVSAVCEIVTTKEEEESRSRNRTQRMILQPSATTAVVGATAETFVANAGSSAGGDTKEDQGIDNTNTTTDSRDGGGQHDFASAKSQYHQEEPPLTVSFATVSECETVRAWLRKGAYSLAAFDVTSGQRRDRRF